MLQRQRTKRWGQVQEHTGTQERPHPYSHRSHVLRELHLEMGTHLLSIKLRKTDLGPLEKP